MGHTYANILLHVVFSTKERRPLIADSFRDRLYEYMSALAKGEFGQALAIGGTREHIHALLALHPTVSLAHAMSRWKSLSSGWVHKTFPEAPHFGWQAGYGAFSVSQSNVARVIAYIEHQPEHHRRLTFEEEFLALLRRHGIEHDPREVWR